MLIWHNILEVAASGQVVLFITADSDFRDPSKEDELHPHLIGDLQELGLDPSRIRLVASLEEAVDEVLRPAQEVIESLRQRLSQDQEWRTALFERLENVANAEADLVDREVEVGIASEAEPFAADVVDEEFDYINHFRRVAIADALPLSGQTFGIELWLQATAFYRVEVATSSFWSAPDRVPAGLDLSSDESVAYFGGVADVILTFEARYDSKTEKLGSPELKRMSNDLDEPAPHVLPRRGLFRRRSPQRRKRERTIPWAEKATSSPLESTSP